MNGFMIVFACSQETEQELIGHLVFAKCRLIDDPLAKGGDFAVDIVGIFVEFGGGDFLEGRI